ncbi:MAG TPA: SGNH/GDSL hydrolase family protein [Thermoanaerobaculia bacterium]|jgi:lysophospholipase L1-like esterase|nr:SGNH/GDSL hydrolase family protein [Thermoanaerobaculia bacterium]
MLRRTRKTLILALALGAVASAAFAQVDFTRYVALGDSLTAGFWSGGLVSTVQVNSYPALIYRQATGSSTGFEQPLVKAPGIPNALQLIQLVPTVIIGPAGGTGVPLNLNLARPYNNLGVPGSRVHDTVATTSGGLHDLILRNANPAFGNTTALQQALFQRPTFVTLWIGNNDVLGAATSGIVIDGATLTTVASFDLDFRTIMANLKGSGAKIAVANIPDVTSIPFITTVQPFLVNPATRKPVLGPDGKLIFLIGPKGQLTAADHVLLTAQGDLAKGIGIPLAAGGTGKPLPDGDVLDAAETATIQARIAAFNAIIAQAAGDAGAALVDANAQLRDLATNGLDIGGVTFTNAYLTGGVFSYDGVHPTPFGYAFVANAFIDAINAKFGANIPEVDLYPFLFGTPAVGGTPAAGAAALAGAQLSAEALRNLFWVLQGDAKGDDTGGNGGDVPPPPPPTPKPHHRGRHNGG